MWVLIAAIAVAGASGCNTFASEEEKGIVIARRAQVRSSTAIVAADLVEVVRGDVLDILDTTTAENGERWLRVRARDAESTEGWIEARNIMPQEMLDRSRELAKEDADIPTQATGQLRAGTNIRFSPDRSVNDNILMKLESGSRFEIVGWKRVPKPKASESTESDDAPKAGSAQEDTRPKRGGEDGPKVTEEANEIWYKVRLPQSISPAPAGWIYGKQVELAVPSDIIFYRTGREFVAWQRLDEAGENSSSAPKDKDAAKEARPGSWVILEKSSANEPGKLDTPDFDRIFVLGYNKDRQEHYTAYRSPDIHGRLPLRVEGSGDSKIFKVGIQEGDQLRQARYKVSVDSRDVLKVEPLDQLPRGGKKK